MFRNLTKWLTYLLFSMNFGNRYVTDLSVIPLYHLVLSFWRYFMACSTPILLIPAQPIPLFARWAWYELGKQTADTLRYFLTLHQLSFPAAVRKPAVRNYPRVELRFFLFSFFFFFFQLGFLRWLRRAVRPGAAGNITDQHHFDLSQMGGAGCISESQTPTALWAGKPSGAVMY